MTVMARTPRSYSEGWNEAREAISRAFLAGRVGEPLPLPPTKDQDRQMGREAAITTYMQSGEVPIRMCRCGNPTHPIYGSQCEDCYVG